MSSSANDGSTPAMTEKTFTAYSKDQGKTYAQHRRDYHPSVYQAIIDRHGSTGGQADLLVDVGCGPGLAACALAPHFAHVIGIDPSEGMLAAARSVGGTSASSEPIRYELSTAEDLGQSLSPPIQSGSVDLITASNAAHWFDMPRFWVSAARALKPGGTVALWTSGGIRAHPSMPNSAAIQAAIDRNRELHLKPFFEPGNLLTQGGYVDLPLPWTLANPVSEFNKDTFYRRDWGDTEEFFLGQQDVNLDMFELMMGTASPATRWRQAHPDAVGTENDVVKMLRREIEILLHEAGVEKGKEIVKGVVPGVLLIVKRME